MPKVLTPIAPIYALNKTTYDIADFGAIPDDGTGIDSSNAILAAHSAASGTTYGGEVFYPEGTFISALIPMYPKVSIRGSGKSSTILKLKNGQNTDLLQGTYQGYTNGQNGYSGTSQMTNIGTPSGQGNTGGVTDFTISNITLDGNRANQTSGTGMCLNFYGYGFTLFNCNIRNAYGNGMLIDWNGGSSLGFQGSTTNSQPFAFVTNVKCHNNGGIGVVWGGPHDSGWESFYSFFNDSHSYQIGPHSPGILGNNCHGFGPLTATGSVNFLIESGFNQFTGCCSEGSDVAQVVMLGNTNIWSGGHIYQISGFTSSGIQLGQIASATLKSAATTSPITLTSALTTVAPSVFFQYVVTGAGSNAGTIVLVGTNLAGNSIGETITTTGNGTYTSTLAYAAITSTTITGMSGYSINVVGLCVPYSGSTFQSAGLGTASAVASNVFETMITRCEGVNGGFWFANDAGNNKIECNMSQNAGSYATGTPNVLTQYEFTPQNVITPTGTLATGGGKNLSIKATNAFRVSDRTNDLFNVNTFSKQLQLPNGMNLLMYSDNYTTKKFSIDQFGNVFQNGSTTYTPSSVAVLASNGTITTSGIPIARVNPAGNVTGIILAVGNQGQTVIVENQSAFTVTFDIAGTSHVSGGTAVVIAAGRSQLFVYDTSTALWY